MQLTPGQNVWRVAPARRAAMLVDGADYFAAMRRAMINARRSIWIAGWDIHSKMRLVGPSGEPEDGYPAQFADFLSALVAARPELDVCLLLWDFSMLYAPERDFFPTLTLRWNTPSNVRFCLDDCIPLGSSQHQKLVVIDDALAFNGGLDITIRRWDTNRHRIDEPHRVDPSGNPYPPFHDVQMMVDGDAARALGDLFRERWRCATSERLPQLSRDEDPWPEGVKADFTGLDIGIARTQPGYDDQEPVQEVERLFFDCIDAAERSIYIENQFLTAPRIAARLAERLKARPQLEVLMIAPKFQEAWLDARSLLAGRIRFAEIVREAGEDRVHFAYPQVAGRRGRTLATMVHAKVMIVDDKILRVGSANLNNRSMGTDTECDLVLTARGDDERRSIERLRNKLIGDHCGVDADAVASALARHGGSLIALARSLSHGGHSLQPIEDVANGLVEINTLIEGVADPEKPIGAEEFVSTMFGGFVPTRHVSTVLKVLAAGLFVIGLAVLWHFVPFAKPEAVHETLSSIGESKFAPVIVVGAFVAAGLVMFPVTVLIAATAAAFGPWFGFGYAAAGSLLSAIAGYSVGAMIGKQTLRDFLGPRLNRVRKRIVRRGVITVAAVRLVPIAPFTVVNLVAGASEVPLFDYTVGTLLGLLPGLIMISAVGHQLARIMTAPTPLDFALLTGAVLGWIALSVGVQAIVSRYWSGGR
ncbi:MAG TPA: VTT domain-containing protein [Pseudolabrys sp.]|nr:VTT domain-containing protein [Pseudolabrys sp.]